MTLRILIGCCALWCSTVVSVVARPDTLIGVPAKPSQDAEYVLRVKQSFSNLVSKADMILLGRVTNVIDDTNSDGGMIYDVLVVETLLGSGIPASLRFRSPGWFGYAIYSLQENVLVFLKTNEDTTVDVKPVCYIEKTEYIDEGRTWISPGLYLYPPRTFLDELKRQIDLQKGTQQKSGADADKPRSTD